MSSIQRKQRRSVRRKLAMMQLDNETAGKIVQAMNEAATAKREETMAMKDEIVQTALEKVEQKLRPDMFAQAMAESIIMVLAFEHIDRHHSGAWLRKWLWEFNAFSESVQESGEPIDALCKILLDECKFDVVAEYKACGKEEDKP